MTSEIADELVQLQAASQVRDLLLSGFTSAMSWHRLLCIELTLKKGRPGTL